MPNDITHLLEAGLTPWSGDDAAWTMTHLTGTTIRKLMRRHGKTINGLASSMGLTQARVREVRANGVIGAVYVMDWMEGVVGNPHAGWDEVARAYLADLGRNRQRIPHAELGRAGPR
jgi:hypothetical protein